MAARKAGARAAWTVAFPIQLIPMNSLSFKVIWFVLVIMITATNLIDTPHMIMIRP